MAKIIHSARALRDLERISDFLVARGLDAIATLELIEDTIGMLADHPRIGRPVGYGLRELIISKGATGYVALYAHDELHDVVLLLAIRHQREALFRR